jgi:hypothetical protein
LHRDGRAAAVCVRRRKEELVGDVAVRVGREGRERESGKVREDASEGGMGGMRGE